MNKLLVAALSVCSALAACGGGGNDSNNPTEKTLQPYSVAYADYNASAGISGTPWDGASFVDNMPTKTNIQTLTQSGWTGQITYGVSSSPKTIPVNNAVLANTSPVSVVGGSSPRIFDPYGATGTPLGTNTEPNLDGAFEICSAAPAGSISDNGFAATDILITGSATQITTVSELAGKSFVFNQYCDPSNQANPQTLTFDSSGNANFELYTGSTNSGPLTAVQVPAASFQSAMNGTPYVGSQQGQTLWTVYRFITATNTLKYVVVERGTADGNYIGMWY
ncbi:Uncharacterised protein [Burkholderia pseudomallei]|uniref:hypothetical protein n=1 Tax=Burkholderia TaxID=32008 RepID=UPI0005DF92FC|nr:MULTISPECIES: hypothetical protein [Burkholderia]CFK64717.1 Uncharacterised protein [Burkholderia pseudomallei]CPF87615.1 Uncharacterised protein [Burkholderia pseudomallei]CPG42289.1 Uncharacterised protein [Burkholderia pseudomallei]